MFNSPILQVVIGMLFFYLLLSLICSALNEMIEAFLNNRANDLERGIRRLLDDPDPRAGGFFRNAGLQLYRMAKRMAGSVLPNELRPAEKTHGLASRLYDHALIRCLYGVTTGPPSYIPARSFALALMDLIVPEGGGAAGATSMSAMNITPDPKKLRAAIADPANVPSAYVQRALFALMDAANNDAVRVRENIENWFNSMTDRISGWYKRRTQIIILVLGVGIAVVLNADSVIVLSRLWHDSALRSSLASEAETYVEQVKSDAAKSSPEAKERLKAAQRQLSSLGLPIGWSGADGAHKLPPSFLETPKPALSWALYQLDLHWLGWFITGLAISLGAPFWFDVLNKFIVVRSTVKPKEKSQDEPSKDV